MAAYYMKYQGIDGDVTEQSHQNWIELASFQLGATRSISGTATGATRGREASLCEVSEITVVKPTDSASQALLRECTIGSVPGKRVMIEVVTTGSNQGATLIKLELENCMVGGYSVAGSGGVQQPRPLESLSLNFTKITYLMAQGDTSGQLMAPKTNYFDLTTGRGG